MPDKVCNDLARCGGCEPPRADVVHGLMYHTITYLSRTFFNYFFVPKIIYLLIYKNKTAAGGIPAAVCVYLFPFFYFIRRDGGLSES